MADDEDGEEVYTVRCVGCWEVYQTSAKAFHGGALKCGCKCPKCDGWKAQRLA